jgi:hypothetical protein
MKASAAPAGVVIGALADFSSAGHPRVTLPSANGVSLIEARACLPLSAEHIGRSVVLVFEEQCLDKPIILGLLNATETPAVSHAELSTGASESITVDVDGHRTVLSAREEIVLRCGKASITLTRAGKVLIRGAYVSSHSTSVNRIKGGSVEIN